MNFFLICFFVSGCGHCTKFKVPWSEASQRISRDKIGSLGIVDATVQENLAQEFQIKSFPTLKLFQNGRLKTEYNGQRTVNDIYKFMKTNAPTKKKDEL